MASFTRKRGSKLYQVPSTDLNIRKPFDLISIFQSQGMEKKILRSREVSWLAKTRFNDLYDEVQVPSDGACILHAVNVCKKWALNVVEEYQLAGKMFDPEGLSHEWWSDEEIMTLLDRKHLAYVVYSEHGNQVVETRNTNNPPEVLVYLRRMHMVALRPKLRYVHSEEHRPLYDKFESGTVMSSSESDAVDIDEEMLLSSEDEVFEMIRREDELVWTQLKNSDLNGEADSLYKATDEACDKLDRMELRELEVKRRSKLGGENMLVLGMPEAFCEGDPENDEAIDELLKLL